MWRLSEALPAAGTWANKPHSPSSQTPTRLRHRRPPGRQARAPRGPFSPGTEQQGRGLAQPGPGPGGETLPSGPLLLLCGPRPSPASRHSQPGHRRASHWGAGPALTGPKHPFPGGKWRQPGHLRHGLLPDHRGRGVPGDGHVQAQLVPGHDHDGVRLAAGAVQVDLGGFWGADTARVRDRGDPGGAGVPAVLLLRRNAHTVRRRDRSTQLAGF